MSMHRDSSPFCYRVLADPRCVRRACSIADAGSAHHRFDFAAWDISIGPDGVGLPAGSGTPRKAPLSTRRNA